MRTNAPKFPQKFNILPTRGLLTGQNQVKVLALRQANGCSIIRRMLERPKAGLENLAELFFNLGIFAH
jgi:hypothetical protein